MCITVIGIPFAIATCILIGLCAIAFACLVLAAAFVAGLIVYLILKCIWCLLTRWPYWISNFRIWRAERALLRGLPPPVTSARDFPTAQWTGPKAGTQKPLQAVPAGYLEALGMPTAPPRLHVAAQFTSAIAVPLSDLPAMVECQICMEEKLPSMFPSRAPTDDCDHGRADCCSNCLVQAIITAFESNMWDDIRCPMCNIQLQHKDVAEFAPPDIFARYDILATRRALEQSLPNFRWCLGPNCSFGQEHPDDPKENPIVVCSSCGFVQCSHHNTPWHTDKSCEEYDAFLIAGSSNAEKRSEKIIKKIAKRCPGCERYINKNGGCGHMTCLCGRQFCWNCLHVYPGHSWGCTRRA